MNRSRARKPLLLYNRCPFCRTSKMSHAGSGRAACFLTIWILTFHFLNSIVSTRRDRPRRWLWRLVGRMERGTPRMKRRMGLRREPARAGRTTAQGTQPVRALYQSQTFERPSAPRDRIADRDGRRSFFSTAHDGDDANRLRLRDHLGNFLRHRSGYGQRQR